MMRAVPNLPIVDPCDALKVTQTLAADKVGVAVLHCPTIKPLDEEAILKAVR